MPTSKSCSSNSGMILFLDKGRKKRRGEERREEVTNLFMLQSLWRGHLVRRNDTKARRVMRDRVKAANSRVEERIISIHHPPSCLSFSPFCSSFLFSFLSLTSSLLVKFSSTIHRYDNWQSYQFGVGGAVGQETTLVRHQCLRDIR